MEFNQETVQRLTQLREKRKFTDSDWDKRGLIPSDAEKFNEMTRLMDSCLDELLVLGLDISDTLNSWLYGSVLGKIINLTKKKEIILDSKSLECIKCKLTLTLSVTAKKDGVPNYWIIGQCIQCGEYNLLSTGENAGGLKFENFISTEILDNTENSEEQAKTRLEQIKYFRGRI